MTDQDEKHTPGLSIPPHEAPRIPFDWRKAQEAIYGKTQVPQVKLLRRPKRAKAPRKLSKADLDLILLDADFDL